MVSQTETINQNKENLSTEKSQSENKPNGQANKTVANSQLPGQENLQVCCKCNRYKNAAT
jgi:hypothetical protein